jgi:hypothetical protein
MICKFNDCNAAEEFWCECERCGLSLYGYMKAEDLNKMRIVCQKPKKLKIYYARPLNLYNTPQDKRDIELMQGLGFEVINPNKEELAQRYKTEGMDVFLQAVTECDALALRAMPDMTITAGVKKEIDKAAELGKAVIELPTITSKRVLSVEDTREYLRLIGAR